MNPAEGPSFIFAGGGTGGHLFPGLAIAEHLVSRDSSARCLYLCSDRPIDAQILREARIGGQPVAFSPLRAKPASAKPLALARFLASWGPSVRTSRHVIRSARGPTIMISMGGFVAAPAVQAARAERVPVVLVNLDAVPGKANRWIARRAQRVFSAVPPLRTYGGRDWEMVSPIVRASGVSTGTAQQCRQALGLVADRPTLLVTGGSQGAGSLNDLMVRFAAESSQSLSGWQVIHQTGRDGVNAVRRAYQSKQVPAVVEPFFDRMGDAWGASDLALSRAGAGSVAEAWANRVPTVFLPYPYHKDLHQRFNAAPLESVGGAIVADDTIDPASNMASAGRVLRELLSDPAARLEMRAALTRLGPVDGARVVADALLAMARTP